MSFTITKISANNFSHFDGFKEMNFSNWEIVFNYTSNTLILQMLNGAPFPKMEVSASDVIIKNGISVTPETFTTVSEIRARLLELNYNPLQSTGGGGGSATWGDITGTLSTQTDLQTALDGKVSKSGDTMTGDLILDDAVSIKPITGGGGYYLGDLEQGAIQVSPNGQLILKASDNTSFKGLEGEVDYSANITDLSYPQKIYVDSVIGNLHREEFTFSGSQTITLANNYGQVYSVEVQGQGALSTSQYTLVAPNQITINDTLDTGDYIVVIYSNSVTGLQPYYSQAETDALITNDIKVWKSGIDGATVASTLTITPTYTQLIPANTFEAGDVVEILFRSTASGGKTSASSNYLYINTTNDLATGSPLQLGIVTSSATARTLSLDRTLSIKVGGLKVINTSVSLASDRLITTSGAGSSMYLPAIDWTVNQYFIFAIGHTVADQTLTGDFYRIIKN